MGYKETVMSEEQIIEAIKEARKDPVKAYARYRAVSSKQAKLTWPIAEKAGIQKLVKVIDFAYGVARVMDDLRSSHVFFILQQAFGEDMEWDDVQEILTVIIEQSQAFQKEVEK